MGDRAQEGLLVIIVLAVVLVLLYLSPLLGVGVVAGGVVGYMLGFREARKQNEPMIYSLKRQVDGLRKKLSKEKED